MEANLPSCNDAEEDYIDMEISSSSNLFYSSTNSPPKPKEFEFQMCSISHEKETSTSPADELFYKGKLLPLHLPPRLQMVQKLLQNSNSTFDEDDDEHFYTIPFINCFTAPSTNTTTPLESCNISPSESHRLSSEELNSDEYFFAWSTELSGFLGDHSKKSWSKKLKRSSLGQKLKASRAFLKALFSKSGCSDQSCAKETCSNVEEAAKGTYKKVGKRVPSGKTGKGAFPTLAAVMSSTEKEGCGEGFNHISSHRKSFSGAIKRHATIRYPSLSSSSSSGASSSSSSSSSSSFSFNSHGFYELQFLKRSSSATATSEIDGSIEAAIAHCKNSQQLFSSRNTSLNEPGFCSFSVSRIVSCSRDQDSRVTRCL